MIQKKSLKEAIQNPEIISVVGGLIGTATPTKNGLMPSSQCIVTGSTDNSSRNVLRIRNKNSIAFDFHHSSNNIGINSLRITRIYNDTNIVAKEIFTTNSSNKVKIYYDENYLYLKKSWAGLFTLVPLFGINIESDYISTVPENATEITIS